MTAMSGVYIQCIMPVLYRHEGPWAGAAAPERVAREGEGEGRAWVGRRGEGRRGGERWGLGPTSGPPPPLLRLLPSSYKKIRGERGDPPPPSS